MDYRNNGYFPGYPGGLWDIPGGGDRIRVQHPACSAHCRFTCFGTSLVGMLDDPGLCVIRRFAVDPAPGMAIEAGLDGIGVRRLGGTADRFRRRWINLSGLGGTAGYVVYLVINILSQSGGNTPIKNLLELGTASRPWSLRAYPQGRLYYRPSLMLENVLRQQTQSGPSSDMY